MHTDAHIPDALQEYEKQGSGHTHISNNRKQEFQELNQGTCLIGWFYDFNLKPSSMLCARRSKIRRDLTGNHDK